MLTKCKAVRPKKDVKGPLKVVFMSAAYSEFFSVREHQIFTYIFKRIFGRIILKHIENIKGCGGSGGMLPRKIFKNLHTAVAILLLFEQFLRKFCLNFLPLNLSVSHNITHFVRIFAIMRALSVRLIVIEKVQN